MDHATSSRFRDLCRRAGVAGERAESAFRELIALYTEENRAYHNLSHIDRMLAWLDASGYQSDAVEFAIWFHDAIYEPLGSHNEAQSAQYFAAQIGSFVGGKLADDVERLVLATDPTRSRSGREDEDLIVDIDLSVLGSRPEAYQAYQTAVRREYFSVPDAEFSAGRRSILQSFLSHRIYATEFFCQLEEQARSNIKAELEALAPARCCDEKST